MALSKRRSSNVVFLEVKHYRLWQALKAEVPGCDVVEVNNPKTGTKVTKYGYGFDTLTGRATKLVKYDTGKKFSQRYFGFKLTLHDGEDTFVLDMPYHSQILRRFLRAAANIEWGIPLSITVFKGKKESQKPGAEHTGIWFHQDGETVRPYYTREEPHGMPAAQFDEDLQQWDFKAQHRWLIGQLQADIIPAIDKAATAASTEPADYGTDDAEPELDRPEPAPWIATDDDVPF